MSRLTRITLMLVLPAAAPACADDADNETNASAEEGTADGTGASFTTTTGPTTTAATDTSVSTTDSATTMPDTTTATGEGTETGPPANCVSADDPSSPKMMLAEEINADTLLTCDTVWVLTAQTYVRGATLTIEPGTHIVGANGSALIIDTDASIEAVGLSSAPIVFTSAQPKGERARADWGGLVMLGTATVNLPNGVGQAEGFSDPPTYGGDDPAHNCGHLEYVRVEWAGFELVEGSELNGITFYACGSGTQVSNVQSHMGSDDALEFFGGGFDAKYVIATGQADDGLDCDQGFGGTFQYVFVHQDPAEPDGNHGLEWSNQATDFTAPPLTSPTVANMTFIGQGDGGNAGKSIGFVIKEGAEATIYSSYFTNATGFGGSLQDQATIDVAEDGGIVIEGTLWGDHAGFGHQGMPMPALTWDDAMIATFFTGGAGNMDGVDLMLDMTWTAPNIKPDAGSAAVGAGMTPGSDSLEAATYVGAVDPEASDDWTQAGWINYAID